MNTKLLIVYIGLLAGVSFVPVGGIHAQQEPEKKKLRAIIEPLRTGGREGARPRAGDRITLDRVTGDWIVEYEAANGSIKRLPPVEPPNKIKPRVTTTYESIGAGLVRYHYTLYNGAGAKQGIKMFALGTAPTIEIRDIKTPVGWLDTGRGGVVGRQHWFTRDERDDLQAGQEATGEFSFVSPALPGSAVAFLAGRPLTGDVPKEDSVALAQMSEWLLQEYRRLTRWHNNLVRPRTIVPKIPVQGLAAQALIAQLYNELVQMGVDPIITQGFQDASRRNDRSATVSYRSVFANMGRTQIEREFFNAMTFNLDYLATIP